MTVIPNAIIVGAGKAGSTSLHNYLAAHPDIAGSVPKEVMYFTANYDKGPQWYLERFPGAEAAAIAFESTPQYSFRDEFPEVPARICAYNRDMRILYIVREPIARIVSHFNHWTRSKPGLYRDLNLSLSKPGHRRFFVERTRYFYQISAYLEHFPRAQVEVVFLEDLQRDFVPALNRVFAFLGVAPLAETIRPRIHNPRPEGGARVWRRADLEPGREAELTAYLRDDVRALLEMCGKPGDFWGEAYR